MDALNREYSRLLDMQVFREDELDYSILDKHIAVLDNMAKMSNSGVTIFDMSRRRHVFASYNFPDLFDYDMERIRNEDVDYFNVRIHPDDIYLLTLNGVKSFRSSFDLGGRKARYKLISEYRIEIGGKYVRVIEQTQVLECDRRGNTWLSLSLLDVSPNQAPLARVESRIFDMDARAVIRMPDYPEYKIFETAKAGLTDREKDVLKLVREGFLSKEISDQLSISVNTVNTHRQRIIEKLAVNNTHEAIRYAEKFGLLE